MKTTQPDILYALDKWLANRVDGGTLSDSISESLGISKSEFHAAAVGAGALVAAVKAMDSTTDIGELIVKLLLVAGGAKLAYEYLEAPRSA